MNNRHPDNMQRALRAYAHRLTGGNPQLADELLAATLTRLAESATAYPPTLIDLTTWAKMVMQNTFRQTTKDADLHELHHLAYRGTLNPMQPRSSKEYRRQFGISNPSQNNIVCSVFSMYTPCKACGLLSKKE